MSRKIVLSTYHVLELENSFFFVTNNHNAIFQIDKITKKVRFKESIPDEGILEKYLVSKMIMCENKIIFVPLNAKKIWIKDLKDGGWKSISLRNGENIKFKFYQAMQYNSKVYLIGCRYPSIVCLDIKTEAVEYIDDVMKELDENCYNDESAYFRNDYVQIGTCFYMASCKMNYIMKFDIQSGDHKLIKIGNEKSGYSGITWDGERFWIAPRQGGIVTIWDGKEDGENLDRFDFHIDKDDDLIRGIVYDKNRLYLLTNEYIYSTSASDLEKIRKDHEKYWIYDCSDKIVRLTDSGHLSVNKHGKEEFRTVLEIDKDELRKFFELQSLPHNKFVPLHEDECFELTDFLNIIKKECGIKIGINQAEGENGMLIWNDSINSV